MPILTKADWERLSGDITRKEYKRAPSHVVWMWMFQKMFMGGNGRRSRGERVQTLRRIDGNRTERKCMSWQRANQQEAIAKANVLIIFLEKERKGLRRNLNNVGWEFRRRDWVPVSETDEQEYW